MNAEKQGKQGKMEIQFAASSLRLMCVLVLNVRHMACIYVFI